MKRALASAITLLAITLSSGGASAQEATAAPEPAPVAVVRVNARSYRDNVKARIYAHRPDDSWTMICTTPCSIDVPASAELRVTIGSHEDEPHSYIVPADAGPEVDLEIKPASAGPLVGGIVTMGSGGAIALSGLLFLALADISINRRDNDDTKNVGYVMIGIGVACAGAGLVWLLSRSHEPRVTDGPTRRPSRPVGYGLTPGGLGFTF